MPSQSTGTFSPDFWYSQIDFSDSPIVASERMAPLLVYPGDYKAYYSNEFGVPFYIDYSVSVLDNLESVLATTINVARQRRT